MSMRSACAAALLLITASQTISAQPPDTFEAASVRPSLPGTRFRSTLDTAQFICSANSLLILILEAYPEISGSRLSGGPAWLTTEYWDLAAKLPPNMPSTEKELNHKTELMLQALLADRFKLVTHREMRDQPVYDLVLAKGGSKLKPSSAEKFSFKTSRGGIEFQHESIEGLANYLYSPYIALGSGQQPADRPVVDRTGLQGFFDFALEWTPDTVQADPAATGASLFTALEEQLGLKLQPRKAAAEFLVIDHAERPSEN
jgi:bla regulator protein BlaR1